MTTAGEYQSGDILAFASPGCISRAIQRCSAACLWTRREYRISHVGIIAPHPDTGQPILYESTATLPADWPCLITGKPVKGVQAHGIVERLRYAAKRKATVWHWPLSQPLDEIQTEVLMQFCADKIGAPYDYSDAWGARSLGFGWLSHLMGYWGYLPPYKDNGKLFCVEFTAMAHDLLDVQSFAHPSHWNPSHFVAYEYRRSTLAKPVLKVDQGKRLE